MIVTIREASEFLKITSNLLYKYSHSDNFPEPIGKRNGRANLYKLSDLEEFLQSPEPKHKYLDKPTIVVKVRCINGCKGEKVSAIIIKGEKPPTNFLVNRWKTLKFIQFLPFQNHAKRYQTNGKLGHKWQNIEHLLIL